MTPFDIPTEQIKRQRKADTAMAQRQWAVESTREGWKVQTGTDTYSIVPHPSGRLACSCPDNQYYGPLGLTCKHIFGLQIYLAEGGRSTRREPGTPYTAAGSSSLRGSSPPPKE